MSEQNILNPTAASELNPDWGYKIRDTSMFARFRPKSGKPVTRMIEGGGRQFALSWNDRPRAIADQLEQWDRQYRGDFFTYYDIDRNRYYSGQFPEPLTFTPNGNDKVTIEGVFEEIQGVPLYQYPGENSLATNAAEWLRLGCFIEERDGFGNDLVHKVGDWSSYSFVSQHGGSSYYHNNPAQTGTGGFAAWTYFGYGFRFWSMREVNGGTCDIYLDGITAPYFLATLDLYAAADSPSSPRFVKVDVPLGEHTIYMFQNGIKNPASAGYFIYADALEVIR
ncbi:MAG TPA: hypothetical protein VN577_19960 [Terriglobales bacterium]|nr:hypothetical protein [Terriglobales bacterium]